MSDPRPTPKKDAPDPMRHVRAWVERTRAEWDAGIDRTAPDNPEQTAEIDAGPYAVPCPRCGANPGEPCWNLRTREPNQWPHRERVTPPGASPSGCICPPGSPLHFDRCPTPPGVGNGEQPPA